MFALIHAMRSRIITSPCFTGEKVIGAILFERTMDGEADGKPVPAGAVGARRRAVPQDRQGPRGRGRRRQADEADARPRRACSTAPSPRACSGPRCARSSTSPSPTGIAAVVAQQFEVAEPDPRPWPDADHRARSVDQQSPERAEADAILLAETHEGARCAARGRAGDAQADLARRGRTCSRRWSIIRACCASSPCRAGSAARRRAAELAKNRGMIASFSRALLVRPSPPDERRGIRPLARQRDRRDSLGARSPEAYLRSRR